MRDAKNDNVFACEMGDGRWRCVSNACVLLALGALDPGTHRPYVTTLPQYIENRATPRTTNPCSAIYSIK